jgi:hypothetical protein
LLRYAEVSLGLIQFDKVLLGFVNFAKFAKVILGMLRFDKINSANLQ